MTKPAFIGFQALTDRLAPCASGIQGMIPEHWRQGRTAYGGLTAGLSLAAIAAQHKDLAPLKSMQMTFVGPVAANPVFETQVLRRGRNVTTIEVKTLSGDEVSAVAICMFGAARESTLSQNLKAPSLPAPEDCEDYLPEAARPFVPEFVKQFETRLIEGGRPMSGAKVPYVRCWSRHSDPASRTGMAGFLTLGDVLPPAAITTFTQSGPVSSMNWQMNILVEDVDSEGGWYQIENSQCAAQDGYSSQVMRFWNRNGDLIAEGLQSIAIFV